MSHISLAYRAIYCALQTLVFGQTCSNAHYLVCDRLLLACAVSLWLHRLYDMVDAVVDTTLHQSVQLGVQTVFYSLEIVIFATRYAVLIGCRRRIALIAFSMMHISVPIGVVWYNDDVGMESIAIWHGFSFLVCAAAEGSVGGIWMCLAMLFYAAGHILSIMVQVLGDNVLIIGTIVWLASWTSSCRKHFDVDDRVCQCCFRTGQPAKTSRQEGHPTMRDQARGFDSESTTR